MKFITSFSFYLFLFLSASAAPMRLLQTEVWYGDNMGSVPETQATRQIEYFYNAQNLLCRKIQTGLLESGQWLLTNYYRYELDAAGNILLSNSLQYGLYDQYDYGFQAANDTILYEYNEAGLCCKQTDVARRRYYLYQYNTDGQLTESQCYTTNAMGAEQWYQTLTYSDFTLGGPQRVSATAAASYNQYNGVMTYDASGHKISELHYSADDNPMLTAAEYWIYDETDNLTQYEKKGISKGEEVDATKIEYQLLDPNTVRQSTYTFNNGNWVLKGGSTAVRSYAELDGAQQAATLHVQLSETQPSAAVLSFNLPKTANADTQLIVYRDGLALDTLDASVCSYTDQLVPNGTHEYFVQTVAGQQHLAVSNIETITLNRSLPCATQVHALAGRLTTDGNYYVTLGWSNPATDADLPITATNVIRLTSNGSTPMLVSPITDSTQQQVELSFSIDPVITLYVETRYAVGHVSSDTVTIDATKLVGKVAEDNRKLRVIETWGDAMGTDQGCTKREVIFYGTDNREQRRANYSRTVGSDDEWTIYEYTTLLYGEDNMPSCQFTQQYGRYYYGEMGFRAPQDTTFFEYNLEGQLTRQTSATTEQTFTYGTDGSLLQQHSVEHGTSDLEQTITYSDFVAPDKPQLTVSTGTLSSYKWTIESQYDHNGLLLQTYSTKYQSYNDTYVPNELHLFIYDDQGTLTSDTVYTIKLVNDVETYQYKSYTTYTVEQSNPNRTQVVKHVWDNILQKFGNPKTWTVNEYAAIDASQYSPSLTVTPVADQYNTVQLHVEVPSNQRNAMTALNIYRQGIEIAHAVSYYDERYYQTDEFGTAGSFVYTDAAVPNGTYDYFVEFCRLDATMEQVAQVNNISEVVTCTVNTQLPSVTNLHEVSRRQTTSENTEEGTTELNVFVTLGWEAPASEPEFGFKRYNVMITSSQLPENEDLDGQAESYELAMRGLDSLQVYVQSVYELGRANSDTILITEQAPSAIRQLLTGNETDIIQVYSPDGRLLYTHHGPISTLPAKFPSRLVIVRNPKKNHQ